MKDNLIYFQEKAVRELRWDLAEALESYRNRKRTQVVSLQAPTGSGKTIIAAALIESVYFGLTLPDGTAFREQPEAIFVWLSDSPELNEQSRQKIELKTSKLRFGQCVTVSEESFDEETFRDGRIYFLNTQKLNKNGKLTQHSDGRQHTIWETLDNTVQNKWDHFYFIIDEAHRGAKSKKEAGADTTVMQRFLMGYDYHEDGVKRRMRPMPVVLGISATAERFNALVSKTSNLSLRAHTVTADEVRSSGLLKDRIVITYPEDPVKNDDFILLEAAVDEWMKKRRRWRQYTYEQHYANVDPVFVVQVRQGGGEGVSDTDLGDLLAKIESKSGLTFKEGEVVHCFGDGAPLTLNGLKILHVNASDIAEDHRIKVVFFKEALSTGWDCPRAETMMSFAVRKDPTYIAQLLGRMVRTPLRMRVARDEFLNDVKLYLPHFNREAVKRVVDELQSNEGGEIAAEIEGEALESPALVTLSAVRSARREEAGTSTETGEEPTEELPEESGEASAFADEPFDRLDVIRFVNGKGFLTYSVRMERINDYLKSLLDLATLLTHSGICRNARDDVANDVIGLIRSYVDQLRASGRYDELAAEIMEYKLSVQVFDPFGKELNGREVAGLALMAESDLDRQLRNADARLGKYGFPVQYGKRYYDENDPNAHKIDCILFAADEDCRAALGEYAKRKLYELARRYRLSLVNKSEALKKKYHDVMADADVVGEQIFTIPLAITVKEDPEGTEYENHLLVSPETGKARIVLNGWEKQLIEEESRRADFVGWLRNPARAPWALCLPCDVGGEKRAFYPDFLVVRRDPELKYVVDLLEPHGGRFADSLPKAKALAEYAKAEDKFGRIQLIRREESGRFLRLELTDPETREEVLRAVSDEALGHIFRKFGKP